MKFATSGAKPCPISNLLAALSIGILLIASTGCGSGPSSTTPRLTGNTNVTVVLSSTANDQLSEFDLGFESITLTSQSGKTVTLLSTPPSRPGLGAEFIHINGHAEPLATAIVPQDVYTQASVSLAPQASFVCIALGPLAGEVVLDTTTYNSAPSTATVSLSAPITVTGASMGLVLNLLVSQSAKYSDCLNVNGFTGYAITPTLSLAPFNMSSSATNVANTVAGLDGKVTAIGSNGSFQVSLADSGGSRSLPVNVSANTAYQGISGSGVLAVGMFVSMDGAIQADGSVSATRIAVQDTSAQDVVRGPLMAVTNSASVIEMHAREQQGKDFPGRIGGFGPFNFSGATFHISGELANLGSLPFVPSFNASNMVPGQEVYISEASIPTGGYPVATSMTLMPQTINGKVIASSKVGSFTDYTVSLASYDLFPMLAVQPGQTNVENNPGQVEVYVDNNTQFLNNAVLGPGDTLRFYGLVFNDGGTLRMDCAQVSDGVTSSSQSNASLNRGDAKISIARGSGGTINTTVTRSR